jgi:CheY-like chemotaxis protein
MTLKLLYVEDNASNLLLVERILRDRPDIALMTATRGEEGLAVARAEQPGLILLDLHLPDMSGVEVLAALHDDPTTRAIPVVAVSADATLDRIAHLRERGVADYVTKPFEVSRLLGVVESYVALANEDVILDGARVAELIGLDPDGETFRSLSAAALLEAGDQIAAISAAHRDGQDAGAVSAAAHSLKSAAAIVGARRLATLADEVEVAAHAGSIPDGATVSELERALAETRRATVSAGGEN